MRNGSLGMEYTEMLKVFCKITYDFLFQVSFHSVSLQISFSSRTFVQIILSGDGFYWVHELAQLYDLTNINSLKYWIENNTIQRKYIYFHNQKISITYLKFWFRYPQIFDLCFKHLSPWLLARNYFLVKIYFVSNEKNC